MEKIERAQLEDSEFTSQARLWRDEKKGRHPCNLLQAEWLTMALLGYVEEKVIATQTEATFHLGQRFPDSHLAEVQQTLLSKALMRKCCSIFGDWLEPLRSYK